MILQISPLVLKVGVLAILFGALATGLARAFGRKLAGTLLPLLLGLLAACASTLTAYRLALRGPLGGIGAVLSRLTMEVEGLEWPVALVVSSGILLFVLARPLSEMVSGRTYRSFYHVAYGSLIAYLIHMNPGIAFLGLSMSLLLFPIFEYLAEPEDAGPFATFIGDAMGRGSREGETRRYLATPLYLLGLMLVILFLPQPRALGVALILALGDPAAALIGTKYGGHRWVYNPRKSLEGSLAMFLVGCLALQMVGIPPPVAVPASIGSTISESLSPGKVDNVVVPLASGSIMLFV